MTEEQLDKITIFVKENIVENPKIIFDDTKLDLIDVIVSLHNILYKEVHGNYYNYMNHWANKMGMVVDENIFRKEVKEDDRSRKEEVL